MPSLRIFGAGPIAEALCALAARAGFEVTVGDPRPAHAQPSRFPDAVTVACGWPDDLVAALPLDRRSFVVSLLHAERFEDVLLPLALQSEARYIGALGSRKTHADRIERLQAAGFDDAAVGRIHGPVGLSIGAVTPEEIAIAILAEIVQVGHQASGTRHQNWVFDAARPSRSDHVTLRAFARSFPLFDAWRVMLPQPRIGVAEGSCVPP